MMGMKTSAYDQALSPLQLPKPMSANLELGLAGIARRWLIILAKPII